MEIANIIYHASNGGADGWRGRLASAGLVEELPASLTLKAFLDSYISKRGDVKPSTTASYDQTRRTLIAFFGSGKPIRDIHPGEADDWRLWLVTHEKLADNTVRRRCGIAKQFFKSAVRGKRIMSNPFTDLAAAVRANTKREYFVSREETQKVLDACPDVEWRLIFALARFGGLRVPSEIAGMRWTDIDWARSRITVRSPKTEHHPGGESRQIRIFPELVPCLHEAFELADEGAEFLVTRYRLTTQNLRTQLTRIIRRAGLEPWPKLFQNLRSTRETELSEK